MKKNNQGTKLPSFRTTIEKRIGANETLLTSSKPEFGQQITNEQIFPPVQSEIAKRIQSKLRLKKSTTGSQKQYSRQTNNDQPNPLQKMDYQNQDSGDFATKIEEIWESSADIKSTLANYSYLVSTGQVKKKIIAQLGILKCQAVNQVLEDLLALRVKKLCQLLASQRKCQDNEVQLGRLFDDRMRKLTDVLRTR